MPSWWPLLLLHVGKQDQQVSIQPYHSYMSPYPAILCISISVEHKTSSRMYPLIEAQISHLEDSLQKDSQHSTLC